MLNFIFEPNGQRARKNAPAFGILQIYSFFSIYKDMSLLLLKHSETLCLTVCTSSLVRYGKQGTIGKTNQLSKNKKWRWNRPLTVQNLPTKPFIFLPAE